MYRAVSFEGKRQSEGQWEQQEDTERERERETCLRRSSSGCQRTSEISCWSKPVSLLLSLSISPLNFSSHLFWQYYQIPTSSSWRSKSNILYNLLMARVRKPLINWHIKYSRHRANQTNLCSYTIYRYINIYIYVLESSQSVWCNSESGPTFSNWVKLGSWFFWLCTKGVWLQHWEDFNIHREMTYVATYSRNFFKRNYDEYIFTDISWTSKVKLEFKLKKKLWPN